MYHRLLFNTRKNDFCNIHPLFFFVLLVANRSKSKQSEANRSKRRRITSAICRPYIFAIGFGQQAPWLGFHWISREPLRNHPRKLLKPNSN